MTKVMVNSCDGKYYVSNGSGTYIREDLTEHRCINGSGGTYFETKEEAQELCDAYNTKGQLAAPKVTLQAGNTYKDKKGNEHHCLFVEGNNAYCVGGEGQTAYVWEANTGKAISLSFNPDYDLHIPVVETRKGSVVFTDGIPDWDSWKEEI